MKRTVKSQNSISKTKSSDLYDSKEYPILWHIEKIIKMSNGKKVNMSFFEKASEDITVISNKFRLTPVQSLLFSHFVKMFDDESISLGDIADSLNCDKIEAIKYMNDIEILTNKKLIRRSNYRHHNNTEKKFSIKTCFRVPNEVFDVLRRGTEFNPPDYGNIDIDEFFSVLGDFFTQIEDDEITYEDMVSELSSLLDANMQLDFVRKIKSYNLAIDELLILLCICHLTINDANEIDYDDFKFLYDGNRKGWYVLKRKLKSGTYKLFTAKLIENTNSGGFRNRELVELTEKTKEELLHEITLQERTVNKKYMLKHDTFTAKKMFYNTKEESRIKELSALLNENNFTDVRQRLAESGMRKGFACLFSGEPGTGKTETVYQIARETGRDIMMIDISDTKSMWFGESEKRIKKIFNSYKNILEEYEKAGEPLPILMINEADAVIGKRMEFSQNGRSVDQTQNTIQNIILQEVENLTGILIATTNLTENMDGAFERRFLYKIDFQKPSPEARQSIWQSMIPALNDADARELAVRYDFSGGEIENISRKRAVNNILLGSDVPFDMLISFCEDEKLNKINSNKKMGFHVDSH
jgi:SpoVK/Ycf46/Vps4 family AAA+-type ATPase